MVGHYGSDKKQKPEHVAITINLTTGNIEGGVPPYRSPHDKHYQAAFATGAESVSVTAGEGLLERWRRVSDEVNIGDKEAIRKLVYSRVL